MTTDTAVANGDIKMNGKVNGHVNGGASKVDSSRYWIQPYRPGEGESFEDAKARFGQLIRDEDIDHWHEHGYIVLERFLSPEEIKNIDGAVHKFMPTSEEFEERSLVYQDLMGTSSRITRGSSAAAVRYDFPYPNSELNNLAFHPLLVAFAERLAETDDLQLSISHLVGKYAGRGDFEQALHTDYSNNTLVVPNKGKRFIDIPIITYLTDVTLDLGPTYVVSQKYTEHRGLAEDGFRHHTKKDFPELYEVEKPMVVPAGSTIIYSQRTFHRGSAMTAKKGHRFVMFGGFHTNNCPWMAPLDHQSKHGSAEFNKFLLEADPAQRALVGFPAVGHAYWKEEGMLEAVGRRYPKMDMRPYGGGPPLETV